MGWVRPWPDPPPPHTHTHKCSCKAVAHQIQHRAALVSKRAQGWFSRCFAIKIGAEVYKSMELKSSEVFLSPSAGWHVWGRFLTRWKSTIPVFPRQICSLRSPRRCAVEKEQRQAGWMAVRGHTLPALPAPTFLPKSSRFEPRGSRGTKPDGCCLSRQRSLPAGGSHV